MTPSAIKYYPFGLNEMNYLIIDGDLYTQSESLSNGLIREIESNIK